LTPDALVLDTGFPKIRFAPGPDRLGLKLPDDAIIRIFSVQKSLLRCSNQCSPTHHFFVDILKKIGYYFIKITQNRRKNDNS